MAPRGPKGGQVVGTWWRIALVGGCWAAGAIGVGADGMAGQAPPTEEVEVPLRVVGGWLLVPVEGPNGEGLTFQIGTGSAVTVLSSSVAARLGPTPALTLGGHALPTESVHTVPDGDLQAGDLPVDGMLSATFLGGFDLLIDVPGGRFVLRPAGQGGDWGGAPLGDPTPIRVLHGVVLGIDVLVNGVEVPGLLELGTAAVLLNPAAGTAAAVQGDGATLQLGGVTFQHADVRVGDHPVFQRVPGGGPFAVVGTPVVLDCMAALSWVRQTLRMCVR